MTIARASGVYAVQSLELSAGEVTQGSDVLVRGVVYSPDGRAPVVVVGVGHVDGTAVFGVGSDMDEVSLRPNGTHQFEFELALPSIPLQPGKYVVRAHAADPEGMRVFDHVERPLVVRGKSREFGVVHLAHRWHDQIDR